MSRLAVIAALPREISGLVRGSEPDRDLKRQRIFLYRLPSAVVVAGGMGTRRAALAFEAALQTGPIDEVISTGLAGSCKPALPAGAVAEAGVIVDVQTGERFTVEGGDPTSVLVTAGSIAGVQEKARLAATYHATMVDMEAATVGRLANAHGLRFRAIKAISDEHDFELASLSRFADAQGHFRTAAFALHTAVRPSHWRMAATLGRNSKHALRELQNRLAQIMRVS